MKIGFKCGRFNIIHHGHIHCFNECKKHCDRLIVLINNRINDKHIISIEERIYTIQNIRCVDEVFTYQEDTEDKWLKSFKNSRVSKKDKLILFHDLTLKNTENLPGIDIVDEIIFIPRYPEISVKKLCGKIRKEYKGMRHD